jgi:hypothetical protein
MATAFALPASVLAQTPLAVQQWVSQARPAGHARLRFWGLDVYDATLWVAPGFRSTDYAAYGFALQLQYLRTFDGPDIARRSLEEMRRLASLPPAQASHWQSELARLLPNVRPGDRLTGVNRPGRPALFQLNDAPVGEIGDAEFSRLFFGIWLAPQTSEPALRQALLAGAEK